MLPNGNVKLTWIPPTDPDNSFISYSVYFSLFRNSNFTPLSSTLTSLNTNTFVHATTAGTAQNCYYFIKANYGSPTNNSAFSDTLGTIFLNSFINIVSGTQDLKYNGIHYPKLNSTSPNFILNKEYPLGIWNILSSGTNTIYPDTIMVCPAQKMNYQVSQADNSGCLSVSNLLMGEYTDIRPPERPYVDSISVLPDGTTVVAWQVPVDQDILKYNFYYNSGSGNSFIDSIKGRNTTTYTYTAPTANSKKIGVFVQAVDSCGIFSSVNFEIRTMFLKTSYNRCAYKTNLSWNHYIWSDIKGTRIETLGTYKIYCSVGGSAYSLIGETKDTNFVHDKVSPGKNICYFIRVVNQRKTVTASSNRSCFFSDQVAAPKFIYLKTVTVADNSSIVLKAYLDNTKGSQGIILQRSENGTTYEDIGFITTTGVAHYSFTDENVSPSLKNYTYRAFVIDSCGNKRDSSNTAKTILLKVYNDENQIFTKQLSWNAYSVFGGEVSGYNVYRVLNNDVNHALIGSTDALTTSFSDNLEDAATQGAKIEYFVEAVEGIANPYKILERSRSNRVAVYMEGNIFVPNAFAPQGENKTWLPITHFVEKTEYHVSVFNRWGKKVFESTDDTKAWTGENCIADVYVYLIDYKNSRGEYMQLKGNVLLLR